MRYGFESKHLDKAQISVSNESSGNVSAADPQLLPRGHRGHPGSRHRVWKTVGGLEKSVEPRLQGQRFEAALFLIDQKLLTVLLNPLESLSPHLATGCDPLSVSGFGNTL